MAFKPYCNDCNTWHREAEGHLYKCPRCGKRDTRAEDAAPLSPLLTCTSCNYVGPADNPNQPFGQSV